MRVLALGEAATLISWLSPRAASLAALARAPGQAWTTIRFDPGAVLHVVRHSPALQSLPLVSPAVLTEPALLERALAAWDKEAPPNWNLAALQPVWRGSVSMARMASYLAETLDRADAETAWVAGLLVPLGWLAASAVDPVLVSRCLEDPSHAAHSLAVERKSWGLDQAAIARRLARLWGLPGWLAAIVGHLNLPITLAQGLGADPKLFQIVQLAVGLVQRHGVRLGLSVGATPAEALTGLGFPISDLARLDEEAAEVVREALPEMTWDAPRDVLLLADLVAFAIENRRLSQGPVLRNLEGDLDELQRLLAERREGEAERLHDQKLRSLAEFAAGAGHEINNPLAVISGQAQYLLNHEPDDQRQKSLQTIIHQTQRIHQTLRDLMQFARPARPCAQVFDLGEVVREGAAAFASQVQLRRLSLTTHEPAERVPVLADRSQVVAILQGLIRNAVEATPPGGWVRVRLETTADRLLNVIVEDSGDGLRDLTPAHREHIFDPFFSGRQAGRGRGLGLPTAWRLARENGGEVRWDAEVIGLTRFVLSLPLAAEPPRGEAIPA